MDIIARTGYLERIRPFVGKPVIKVLAGQRRVGKSCIMQILASEAEREGKPVLYINKELECFSSIRTHEDLHAYVRAHHSPGCCVYIDEVQEIKDFHLAMRSLLAEGDCDLYCSGSNSSLLSGELATLLAGRCVSFTIHSLSYREFLQFHGLECGADSMQKYMRFGGMPFLVRLGLDPEVADEYLRNVSSSILLKDVVARTGARNVSFLQNLLSYLGDNIGKLFSANNITKYLKSRRVSVNTQSTLDYLQHLAHAYAIHHVRRADVGGLHIFEIGEKCYFEDWGLRNATFGYQARRDAAALMENIVCRHLLQCGYQVYVGVLGKREIDFVGVRQNERLYVQVSLSVSDDTTYAREFGNLQDIRDQYPKYVVTLNDPLAGGNDAGIRHLNLHDFLLTVP